MDASDLLFTQWAHQVKEIWSEMHQYRQESFALAISDTYTQVMTE
jgi:hypothetical protein